MAPSCSTTASASKDAGQQEAVASTLERLKPGHFQAKRLAFEIRDVGFTPAGTLDTLQLLVRWIFDRAMSDPERYAAPCASLCFSLTPILPTFKPPGAVTAAAKAKRIDFRQTLLNLCQREFEAGCTAAVASAPEQAATAGLSGSLQFLSHLYLHHLLTDRIMLSCLLTASSGGEKAAAGGGDSSDETLSPLRAECLVKALLVAGRQLEESLAAQHRPLLDGLYDRLRTVQASGAASSSNIAGDAAAGLTGGLQAQLADLLELRATGWPRSNGAASPFSASAAPSSGAPPHPLNGHARSSSATAASTTGPPQCRIPQGADGVVTAAAVRPCKLSTAGRTGADAGAKVAPIAMSVGGSALAGNGAGAANAPAGPSTPPTPLRRGLAGSSSSILSRPSSQQLEGLWGLTADTYSEVRAQLLSHSVVDSPAALEATADELVESAVAASGGISGTSVWPRTLVSPRSEAATGSSPAEPEVTEEAWAAEVQREWDEQYRVCELYVRLCVDALQQMSTVAAAAAGTGGRSGTPPPGEASGGSGGSNGQQASAGGAGPGSGAASGGAGCNGVSDTGRTFRRLLLLATQSHFERCLAALLPPQLPAAQSLEGPGPAGDGVGGGSSPSAGSSGGGSPPRSDTTAAAAEGSGRQQAVSSTSSSQQQQQRRAWADLPAYTPDEASALPRARGICHLLLGLLSHGVLTPRIVLHCAAALVDGAAGGSAACLQCACILLAGAAKQAGSFKMAEAAAFESLVKQLQGLAESEAEADAAGADGAADGGAKEGRPAEACVLGQRRRFVAGLVASLRAK